MEIDIDAISVQLREIEEYLDTHDLAEVLMITTEILAIQERLAVLHLRVVP